LAAFSISAFAQERDDVVFFNSTPPEGVSFNNIGVGGAILAFESGSGKYKYYGLNLNYYHKHSWWTLLANANVGKASSKNPECNKLAYYAGAYAGVDLIRSQELAFELYPVGVCFSKVGNSEAPAFSLGMASRFTFYFRYNMAMFVGGEGGYSLKNMDKKFPYGINFGIMLSL
jgi:hypothetical protein